MARDFLYCEETDTKLYANDVVTISTYPDITWIVKQGWYRLGTAQKHGWYFISLTDKTILPIDLVDIKNVVKDSYRPTSKTSSTSNPEITSESAEEKNYLETPETKIFNNDTVIIASHPEAKFIAKYGWFTVDDQKQSGWYFVSLEDRSIIPLKNIELSDITKEQVQVTISEFRPILKDMDTPNPVNDYLVISGTNIRLYDSDIVKISGKPRIKWVVHTGWYIYEGNQNFGWYFVSIKDGTILPASIIDLTLCTLVTTKTQGSERYDGKVVNYTRPFTLEDAETLNRAFITVETIEQRDNLDNKKLVNGRLVRVNDVGGVATYYRWDAETKSWVKEDFGGGSSGGIPEVVGTTEHPIILSELEPGLYRVIGTYKISHTYAMITLTGIHHLAFVSEDDNPNIKVITDSDITDYVVTDGDVTFSSEYATKDYVADNYVTKQYVDNKIAVIEAQISEIISEFHDKVLDIVNERLEDALNDISESYINSLFD